MGDLARKDRAEIVLGKNGERAIARVTADGRTLLSMRVNIKLDAAKNHVWELVQWANVDGQLVKNVSRQITAAGYDYLNKYAGIRVYPPMTIPGPGGRMVSNPYVERDASGEVGLVVVGLIGEGRSATGNLRLASYTLHYDLRTYFVQDVMSKWLGRKKDAVSKTWGKMWSAATMPDEVRRDPRKKLLRIGEDVLALDLDDREVQGLLAAKADRQKYPERNAQTICRRNLLKQMLGEAVVGDDLHVEVTCWIAPDGEAHEVLTRSQDAIAESSAIRIVESIDSPDSPALEGGIPGEDLDESDSVPDDGGEPGAIAPAHRPMREDADVNDELIELKDSIRALLAQVPGATKVLKDRALTPAKVADSRDLALLREVAADLREATTAKGGRG